MSILGLYADMWWDAPETDLEDDDPPPATTCEILTVTGPCGWWSADQTNDDDE